MSLTSTDLSSRLMSRLHALNIQIEGDVARPVDTEALASLIDVCNQEETPVTISGRRVDSSTVRHSNRLTLDLSLLKTIRRLRPDEQLITVETGIKIRDLDRALKSERLALPFLYASQSTLAEVLADRVLSYTAHQKNALPHWVTGVEVLTGDGQRLSYGGEIVKNVTGHNLARLFIGTHNQFGIITAVTLKLLPEPSASKLSLWHFDTAADALKFIRQSLLLDIPCLTTCTLVRQKNSFGLKLMVKFDGAEADVNRCLQYCQQHYQSIKLVSIPVDILDSEVLWEWADKLDWPHEAALAKDPHWLLAQLSLPPKVMLQGDSLNSALAELLNDGEWIWNGLSNTIQVRWSSRANLPTPGYFETLSQAVEQLGGRVDILAMDPTHRESATLLKTPLLSAEKTWLTRLKKQFDPNSILHPLNF